MNGKKEPRLRTQLPVCLWVKLLRDWTGSKSRLQQDKINDPLIELVYNYQLLLSWNPSFTPEPEGSQEETPIAIDSWSFIVFERRKLTNQPFERGNRHPYSLTLFL